VSKLKAMFLFLGVATVGGTTYQLALLKAEHSVADAVDAGLLQVSVPARIACTVRVVEACAADAGIANVYQHVQLKARLVRDAGAGQEPIIAFNLPDSWRPCIRLAGAPREVCQVLENGTCTPAAVCGANAPPQVQQSTCACRRPDAGLCRVPTLPDGGGLVLAPLGATLQPGWVGPGCFRKFCGPEFAGEQGLSWPANCPEK
jgi:hypothetical protein